MLKHAVSRASLLGASLLVLSFSTAAAQEGGGYYTSLKAVGGISSMDVALEGESTSLDLYDSAPELVAGPSLAFGYQWKNLPVRTELEWLWRYRFDMNAYSGDANSRVFKSNVGTQSLYVNAFYDVPLTERLFEKGTMFGYVGAGIGVAYTYSDATIGYAGEQAAVKQDHSEVDLTWMATVGVRYKFTQSWAVDFSYRYTDLGGMSTGDSSLGTAVSDSYTSHDFLVGLSYGW